MKLLIALLLVSGFWSCKEKAENRNSPSINTGTDAYNRRQIVPDTGIYSIKLNYGTISLQQWDSTVNLEHDLGKPITQKIKKLDLNSDTFAGSFIKDMEFEGLTLKLFSPPQNGKTFWIQEIILTGNKYKTTKGIGLGDEFDKVKHAYPFLQKFPGNNENMYYIGDQNYEKSMEMEFEKNTLKTLRLYYMIQ